MLHSQRFCLDNVYCAPGQDKQFSFRMKRINKPAFPPKGYAIALNATKRLPTANLSYQVFTIGNLPPPIVNLLAQSQAWFKDTWVKASDDMVARDYLFKVYNEDGLVYPSQHVFYSFTDQNSLLIVLEVTDSLSAQFPVESFNFLHLYSNAYFNTTAYNSLPIKVGVAYKAGVVNNNLEKVTYQSFVTTNRVNGGDVYVYVNGYYAPEVTLSIPDGSFIEVIYDQSVRSREMFDISTMRTFSSAMDAKVKYLVYRQDYQSYIQYQDDAELYVIADSNVFKKGLYFYKHAADVMRNVTDKDYSVASQYLNNTAVKLGTLTTPGLTDKKLVLYNRHSGKEMPLVFSSLKLHELYKLPDTVQKDVISNTGYTNSIYRAETLEASDYFKVASSPKMMDITQALAASALGYSSLAYYYANTPQKVTVANVTVPELYQWSSTAFEYDANGKYTNSYPTNGPLYVCTDVGTAFVEFVKGAKPVNFGALQANVASSVLINSSVDIIVLSAYFSGATRQSVWEDITYTNKVVRTGNSLSWTEEVGKKIKLIRSDEINVYDLNVSLTNGFIYFPLENTEDRGTGLQSFTADVPYMNVSLYLNGYHLAEGIDYKIDFPYVSVFNKKYIDYSLPAQKLHVRCSGVVLDKLKINEANIDGFVNNGVLTRNSYYDLRQDRVFSVFIGGKLYDKDLVVYSEDDNTVRTSSAINGLPYTVRENFIPVRFLSNTDTRLLYNASAQTNKKISQLFNLAFPEPAINPFNVIASTHLLFSPVVSKMLNDILTGVIASSVYSTPYNDNTILDLLANNYAALLKLDPVKTSFPSTIVTIHPHLGNTVITLDLLQYRFIQNVIRIITNNQPDKVNMSGYIALSA